MESAGQLHNCAWKEFSHDAPVVLGVHDVMWWVHRATYGRQGRGLHSCGAAWAAVFSRVVVCDKTTAKAPRTLPCIRLAAVSQRSCVHFLTRILADVQCDLVISLSLSLSLSLQRHGRRLQAWKTLRLPYMGPRPNRGGLCCCVRRSSLSLFLSLSLHRPFSHAVSLSLSLPHSLLPSLSLILSLSLFWIHRPLGARRRGSVTPSTPSRATGLFMYVRELK